MLELIFYVLYLAFTIFITILLMIKVSIMLINRSKTYDHRISLVDIIIILIISLLWSNWYIVM